MVGFSQEMTVFLGLTGYEYYEDDRKLIQEEVRTLLSHNLVAFDHWKTSRTYNTIAFGSGAIALGTAIAVLTREKDRSTPGGLIATSIGTTLLSIIFTLSANNQKKKTVLSYNRGLEQKTIARWKPKINSNGLGISLHF
jgi:hypothetical protein